MERIKLFLAVCLLPVAMSHAYISLAEIVHAKKDGRPYGEMLVDHKASPVLGQCVTSKSTGYISCR